MTKRNIVLIGVAVVAMAAWFLWPESEDAKHGRELLAQAKKAAHAANPQSGEYRQFVDDNKKLFAEENMYSFSQLIDMARTGRVSLVSELWKLRARCTDRPEIDKKTPAETSDPIKMNLDECNIRIENYLRAQYPAPDNEKIIAMFRNYLRYEDGMRQFRQPENLTESERNDAIKKKRREYFSDADAALIFGYEEAKSSAEEAVRDFIKTSANLPSDQRIKKYYELRGRTLGDYNAAMTESEPQYTRYETELMLRSDEIARQGNAQQMTQNVREKYFGQDGAKRMAQVDAEIKSDRARIDAYEVAAKKFLTENSTATAELKKAKLDELRTSLLGKEESEAYERRMQYEEYLRANNMK